MSCEIYDRHGILVNPVPLSRGLSEPAGLCQQLQGHVSRCFLPLRVSPPVLHGAPPSSPVVPPPLPDAPPPLLGAPPLLHFAPRPP